MNSLIDEYRSKYDDPRSDSEILSGFISRHPDFVSKFHPDALADFERLKNPQPEPELAIAPSEPEPAGVTDYLKQGAGSLIRGVSEGLASVAEGAATFKKGVREVTGLPLLTASDLLDPSSAAGKDPASDRLLKGVGTMLRNAGEAAAPDLVPELEKSWAATKIPKGVGSAASFMAGGAASKAFKIPGWLGIAGFGAASTGQGFYDEAIAKGADERTGFIASLVGNIVGTSEAIPLAGILNRIDKVTGGSFTKDLIKNGVKESFEEAVQNSAQQVAQNFTAQQLYEKDRELFEMAGEAAQLGGAVGFVVSTLASALGLKLGRKGGEKDGLQEEKQTKEGGDVPPVTPASPAGTPPATPTPVVGTDISDVAAKYELTPEEVARLKKQREELVAAHPELATPPADTPEQAAVEIAAAKTDPDPTPAEKKSGKYEKGQVVLDTGITVDIENAAGSTRSGKDKDGEEWSVVMPATYGEILGVKGKDKDWLDIYIGPDVTKPNVYVVNQINPETGKFDEQKVMAGFNSLDHATSTYDAAFSDGTGPSRRQSVAEFTKPEFQEWLASGDKNKPAEKNLALPVVEASAATATTGVAPVAPSATQAAQEPTPPTDLSTPSVPASAAPAVAPTAPVAQPQPVFNQDELISLIDWPSTEGEGRQMAQVVQTEAGKGKQSAPAFEESGMLSKAMADSTAKAGTGAYGLSKKLGLFLSQDGTKGVIASLYPTARAAMVSTPSGGMKVENFVKSGYQLVGSVKLKVPLKGFNLTVEAPALQQAMQSMRDRQGEARQEFKSQVAATPPASAIEGSVVMPDEIIEGFTRDEAGSLWSAVGHLKPEELVINLKKLDGEAKRAIGKIYSQFLDANLSDDEAARNTITYVNITKSVSGGSKEAFVNALASEVDRLAENYIRQSKEEQAAGQPYAAAKPAGNQKGGAAKEGGSGTGSGAQPGVEGKPGVRFQGIQSVPDWRLKTPDIKRRMLAAFEGFEASGWSVTQIGEELNGHVQEFGGYTDPAARSIVIYTSDQHAPDRGNLITVFHEAFDAVMSQEPLEKQMMAHLAVKDISDEALGIVGFSPKISPLWSSSEAEIIRSHERLSQYVAIKLEARGFDPAEARGLWQAIVRWLRDKWYRVALAIQKAAFGPEHVNMQTAEAYFTNRLMSLLAGDTGNYSFVSWLGGPKPTGGQVADTFAKSTGMDELGQRFDPNTGEMIYAEVNEDSESAVKFNNLIRYQGRKLSKVTDELVETGREPGQNYTAQAEEKIAAQNGIKAVWQASYAAWNNAGLNSSGITFEQWLDSGNFVKVENPERLKALQQEGLAAAGAPAANPDVLIAGLPPHAQPRAANIAFKSTLDEKNRMEAQLKSDVGEFAPMNARLQKNAQRLNGVVTKFEDLDYMGSTSLDIHKEMIDEMGRDAKDIKQIMRKFGALSSTINELEGKMDDKLAKDYSSAMQRNYKRWRSSDESSRNFANTLRAAAETEIINWSTDSPTLIKTKLLDAARTTPELAHLLEPSMDRRAEMAMLVAFGKKHFEMVTFLSMQRRAASDEKAAVSEAVKLAMGTHRAAGQEARQAASKAKRYAFQAGRLVDTIERLKAENRSLLDTIVRMESFAEFYNAAKGTIANQLNELGRIIGAQSEAWEAHHGATASIPRTPTEPEDQWEKVTLEFKNDGTTSADVVKWIVRIQNRLDSKPQSSWSVQERALDVIGRKLSYEAQNTLFRPMRGNIATRMIGSITDKLASTGHPAAVAAAAMIRRIDAFANIGKRDQEILGAAWSKHEGRLMTEARRILGRKFDLQSFRDLVYNPMGKYFENRGDFWSSTADKTLAKQNATTGLREHFRLSADTEALANDPKFWRVMQDAIDQTEKNINFLISVGKLMGRKIEDMGYFRDIIGATLNYMPRKWRRTTEGIFNEMQKNWDGTKDKKLDGDWVADEYATDPATLRAKVAARLTPSLWISFVRAIVEKTGRSSFFSPQEGSVRTLAMRENLMRALEASNPLDLVGFAENLYDIESASLTGQPIMAKEDYVAEVLGTFQNFYQILHSEYADRANSVNHGLPTPNSIMMDARVSNEAPSSWLEYLPLDGQTMRLAVRSMAFQFGGGKNLDAIRLNFNQAENELSALDAAYNELRNKLRATGLAGASLRNAMINEAETKGGKGHLIRMEQASRNARLIGSMKRAFDGMVKMQLDIPMELRTWIELIGTVAGMTVQGIGTSLTDLSYMFIQPFRSFGLTKEAFEFAGGHAKTTIEGVAGSMGWLLGKQLNLDADLNRVFHEMGWDDSDASLSLRDKFTELTHEQLFLTDPDGRTVLSKAALQAQRGIKLASRGVRQLLGTGFTGFQRANPNEFNYPTFKLFSPFTMVSQFQHLSTAKQMWKFVIPRVSRAMDFFNANPAEFNDPTFKFTAKQLGMSEQAFNYIQNAMNGYGMNFEMLARDAMRRRAADPMAEILTPESYRSLGVLGTTETVMESGLTTRMPSFLTNPWLAAAAPLMSWSVQAANVLGKRADPVIQADGAKATAKATWNMLLPYAAVLPVGIAFALFREWFDEHFQGKKANVQGFGQNNDFLAVVEKASRASVFGMAGDVVNSLVNTDTNRPFSVDSRVLFLSSIFGLGRATSTWVKQGFDYQSVGRPYISALGGSGFLQNVDVLNHAMTVAGLPPLIEAEAKIVAKINVQNYLRAGGRSLEMDVRTGTFGAQSGLPNPAKPHVGQMLLSAYVNDPQGFMEANRNAVIARMKAEKVSYDKAKDYVKRSYQGMNPLTTVFQTQPSESEFMRLVASMPEHGRVSVMTAMRNYNYYGKLLGLEPSYGKKPEKPKSINRLVQLPRIQDVRRQAMAY